MTTWIWQQPNWPQFTWDAATLAPLLRELHQQIGELVGKAAAGGTPSEEQSLNTLLQNILASSEIENETLNAQSVRSSLAKRLHITKDNPYPVSERSEGIAELMMDAIGHAQQPLRVARLYQWHEWLFPQEVEPFLSSRPQRVGTLRGPEPMQVVSGRLDRPTIHFIAPPHTVLEHEVARFIDWFNQSQHNALLDPLLRAGICHLWFVTLHPFEDGNGRLTRALTDMALAQANPISIYLYAMSPFILAQRKDYYLMLEKTQRGDLVITAWLHWFLQGLKQSLQGAIQSIDRTIAKARFWQHYAQTPLLNAQIKVLNRLLDGGEKGFEQGINASQYQKVAKVSKATATRHLADLVAKGCLERSAGGGRSTRYKIAFT